MHTFSVELLPRRTEGSAGDLRWRLDGAACFKPAVSQRDGEDEKRRLML